MKHEFTYSNQRFMLDGQPITILSGAIHYFRTVPEYWEVRQVSSLKIKPSAVSDA